MTEPFLLLCFIVTLLSVSQNVLLYADYSDEFENASKQNKTIEDVIPKLKELKD